MLGTGFHSPNEEGSFPGHEGIDPNVSNQISVGTMRSRAICTVVATGLTFAAFGAAAPVQADSHEPEWAAVRSASIHPGVKTFTEGAQCTVNFVFADEDDVYIGQAAHCSATDASTETNGCDAESLPVDTEVEVEGASEPATMVYNSWITMRNVVEVDSDTCNYNDFALVRLDPADHDAVNPSVPVWGGPHGIAEPTSLGDSVFSAANSSIRLGFPAMLPKRGLSFGTISSGWTHPLYTVAPGIPGDSGAAYLDANGNALGVLSTLALEPWPAANNVTDLGMALGYMKAHTDDFDAVELVHGTESFDENALVSGLVGGLLGG